VDHEEARDEEGGVRIILIACVTLTISRLLWNLQRDNSNSYADNLGKQDTTSYA
jgi:hypothetical protein